MKKHLFLACALAFGMSACSQHQEQPAESGSPVKTTISPVTAPGKKPDRPAVKLPPKSVPVPSVSPSYNNTPLSPRIPGVTVNRVAVPDKVVALTFDDGPHGTLTPRVLDILRDMGANIDVEPDAVTVHPSELHGVKADMSRCPDLVPTIAVLAAHASGSTRLWNAAHLRLKECDRIAVPAQELGKVGVRCDEHDDGLTIHGDPSLPSRLRSLDGIDFSAHGDHRIAMSLALLELRGARLTLDDPACVGKSFPNFWECWGKVRV